MFDNIGGKLKGLAVIICVIGICCTAMLGIVQISIAAEAEEEEMILNGFITIIVGSLASWIGSFFIYGFGELVETNTQTSGELIQIKNTLNNLANSNFSSGETAKDGEDAKTVSFCGKCGNKITAYPCEHCGNVEEVNKRIPVDVFPNEYGYITCPICKMVQAEGNQMCQQCGQLFINKQKNISYWCGKCGKKVPFDTEKCPDCGSALRSFKLYDD